MWNRFKLYLKNRNQATLAALLFALSFAAYAAFPLTAPKIQNSPDDAANLFFIQHFTKTGELFYTEPLNEKLQGRVVSRSMVDIGRVVPLGFPGLALIYGLLAFPFSLFGAQTVAIFFTPALVALSVAMLYVALRKTNVEGALIRTVVYAANPALWYYASRGLYPNAAVMALVVIAASLIAQKTLRPLAYTCIALAIFIRPFEMLWIVPMITAVLMLSAEYPKQKAIRKVALLAAAAGVLIALTNIWVYGNALQVGYSQSLGAQDALASNAPTIKAAFGRMFRFGLYLFPFHALLAIVAGALLFARKELRKPLLANVIFAVVIMFPYAYFGARDLIGPDVASIGTSLTRYWLPAFLLMTNIFAVALARFKNEIGKYAVMITLTIYVAASFHVVWFGTVDSLAPVTQSLTRYESVKQEILKLTPENALIIVEQGDKVLFPDRKVIAWLRNPGTLEAIPEMQKLAPTFYFGLTLSDVEMKQLESERLQNKLHFKIIQRFDQETLYTFTTESVQ